MGASRTYATRLLSVVALGSMTQMTGRLLLSPLLPEVLREFRLTSTEAGIALSVLWGCGALVQYPSGRLSDQLTRKTVLVASYTVLGAGVSVLVVSDSFPTFLLGVCFFGLGTGLFLPASIAQIADLYTTNRATALGVNVAAVNVGGLVAAYLAGRAVADGSWRGAYLALLPVLGLLLILTHRWNDQSYELSAVSFSPKTVARRIFGSAQLRTVIVAAALFSFAWQGVAGFLPVFLQTQKGFTPSVANWSFGAVFALGIVVNPVTGRVGDRWGHLRTAIGAALVSATGLVGLLVVRQSALVLGALFLVALGFATFWPVTATFLLSTIPRDTRGADYGAVRTVYNALGSLGPFGVGATTYYVGYSWAFGGLAILLLVAALTVYNLSLATAE